MTSISNIIVPGSLRNSLQLDGAGVFILCGGRVTTSFDTPGQAIYTTKYRTTIQPRQGVKSITIYVFGRFEGGVDVLPANTVAFVQGFLGPGKANEELGFYSQASHIQILSLTHPISSPLEPIFWLSGIVTRQQDGDWDTGLFARLGIQLSRRGDVSHIVFLNLHCASTDQVEEIFEDYTWSSTVEATGHLMGIVDRDGSLEVHLRVKTLRIAIIPTSGAVVDVSKDESSKEPPFSRSLPSNLASLRSPSATASPTRKVKTSPRQKVAASSPRPANPLKQDKYFETPSKTAGFNHRPTTVGSEAVDSDAVDSDAMGSELVLVPGPHAASRGSRSRTGGPVQAKLSLHPSAFQDEDSMPRGHVVEVPDYTLTSIGPRIRGGRTSRGGRKALAPEPAPSVLGKRNGAEAAPTRASKVARGREQKHIAVETDSSAQAIDNTDQEWETSASAQ